MPLALAILLITTLAASIPTDETADQRTDPWFSHAVVIDAIDPAHEGFADLEPLMSILADVPVVQLGEASHGDGATFLARRRLLAFLRERLGFDVLAWESGLWDVTRLDQRLSLNLPVGELAADHLARPWVRSGQALAVLEDVRAWRDSERPVAMTGFDCQSGSLPGLDELGHAVRDLFAEAHETLTDTERADLEAYGGLLSSIGRTDEAGRRDLVQRAEALHARVLDAAPRLAEHIDARELALLERSLWNGSRFLALYEHIIGSGGLNSVSDNNIRDDAMGRNLHWLARERFAGRRIATWVASFHAARNLPEAEGLDDMPSYEGTRTMGDVAHELLGRDVYVIGFCSHHGASSSSRGTSQIPPARAGSLEDRLHGFGHPYLFVDLAALPADHPLREPQVGHLLGHGPIRATWPDVVDGLFFIDEMFAATEDGEIPASHRAAGH